MNTATRFDDRVENYIRYRPHYPSEMLDLFRKEMDLEESNIIADIGSGTGISAKLFLENGNKVIGIEPNELMRKASEEYLSEFTNFTSRGGTAEDTGLTESSTDIIIAAQAFHWFDNAKTLSEFHRILKKDGHIALIWNERQLDTNDFLIEYEKFLIEFGIDYQKVRHDKINEKSLKDFFNKKINSATLENSQTLDFEGLLGRILSSSYMPSEENPRYESMQKTLKRLFAQHSEKGKIKLLYNTNIFFTKI